MSVMAMTLGGGAARLGYGRNIILEGDSFFTASKWMTWMEGEMEAK